ncbi:MAG: hypothetical protein E7157_00975 [Lactobacillales bacterium]|nr:hypothetical protein [Lactobacillales bacterium]
MRELPKVFANKIDKKFENNKSYCISKNEEKVEEKSERTYKIEKNINQKINEIFSSPKYVYKADVIITTNEGNIEKRIVGKNGNNLITIDNELISIDKINDIKYK